jgi:hypothetical protein
MIPDQGGPTSRESSLVMQAPVKINDAENSVSPNGKFKKKETLIVSEVSGGLAYTANVYVLDALLAATVPETGAVVIPALVVIKVIGFLYCAYGWFTT